MGTLVPVIYKKQEKGDRSMKGSLIIVSFFIIGTLCGFYHLIPYDFTDSKLSYYALCGLMFCVGISIGNDPNTLKSNQIRLPLPYSLKRFFDS